MGLMILVASVLVCAQALAAVPSNEEIDAAFSGGGSNFEILERFRPLLPNTLSGVDAPIAEVRRAQFCVLTNVLSLSLATNDNLTANFDPISLFVTIAAGYRNVQTNSGSMLRIASYINSFGTISTNNYAVEMATARANSNVVACVRRWRSILGYNMRLPEFRRELIDRYSDGYKACLASLPDDQKDAFTSNVVEAARFNAEELRQLQRGIWDD